MLIVHALDSNGRLVISCNANVMNQIAKTNKQTDKHG